MTGDEDGSEPGAVPVYRSPSKVLLAALAGAAGFAGTYAIAGPTHGYLLEPFSVLLTRYTPAVVFRFLRNEFGSSLQGLLAAGLGVGFLAVLVLVALSIASRVDRPETAVVLSSGLAAVGVAGTTGTLWPAAGAGLAVGIVVAVSEAAAGWRSPPETSRGRRRVLAGVATVAGVGLVGGVLGSRVETYSTPDDDGTKQLSLDESTREEVDSLLAEAERKSLSVAGLEPVLSTDFYSVDINKVDPEVDAEEWTLSVTGEVERELTFDYRDIRAMESEHRFVSLRCVSDSINGGALDNALWTGVPAARFLDDATPEGNYVLLHGVDDYSVGFPLAAFEDGMLAYGMNGKILPRKHGYPVRALVPGHWGETNAKWITEIEVTEEEIDGFWEQRGWQGTGPVHTVAKLTVTDRPEDGRIRVAGHAYAGTRGVSGVEVSTDGGDIWNEAELSEPLPGDDVWRQWVYEYDSPGERHEVVVRAIEADGTVQPREPMEAHPSGATGWVSETVEA